MNGKSDITEFGVIIAKCRVRLLYKTSLPIVFDRRICNGVAYTFARRSITSIVTVIDAIPPEWLATDLTKYLIM
ncbi:hypothetical protein LINGRAHAP2_LOCUS28388 [Linum grandiflorum]